MCKKVVFLLTMCNFPSIESRLSFERAVRTAILPQYREICLEICHMANPLDLKNLVKKKLPNMVIFHECNDTIIENSLMVIRTIAKKDFLVLIKERLGLKNNPLIGQKIEGLKNVPMFLTAVPAM